jgi:HEAT repeat protein
VPTSIHPRFHAAWRLRLAGIAMLAAAVAAPVATAAEPPAPPIDAVTAWKTLPAYRHGQDLAPLLVIERESIAARTAPTARAACAARLATVLEQPDATADARQWVCLLLRSAGTPAEVPLLAEQLYRPEPETADAARQALESIQGDESLAALRNFLMSRRAPPEGPHAGLLRTGIVDSLGGRRDTAAVPLLSTLADDADPRTAAAAIRSLALIADGSAISFLRGRGEKAGIPTPPALVEPLVRAAAAATLAGDRDAARSIRELLARPNQAAAARQAGLSGLLDDAQGDRMRTTLEWLRDADPDRRAVATAALSRLDDAAIAKLLETLGDHEPPVRQAILSVAASRLPAAALPVLLRAARADDPRVRVTAIECLGQTGAADAIPVLLDALADAGESAGAARNSLLALPRSLVGPALVTTLAARPQSRLTLVKLLGDMGEHTAVEPLAALAAGADPALAQAALDGLRRIAVPDAADIGRLVDVFATVTGDERHEAVARVIVAVAVAGKAAAVDTTAQRPAADPGSIVMPALEKRGVPADDALPLVGRLGGAAALAKLEAGLASSDPRVRDAAIRGLCHWPNAEVADRLLAIARDSLPQADRRAVGQRALRSYVRVITLKNKRTAAETLALLQGAMQLAAAGPADDRGYILERTAAAVRSMEAVEWVAGHLDDPAVAQAACRAVLELAHHRYLRQPNKDRFDPILDRVAAVATDPALADRARRYKMGL